jgi:hypothetical protein
MCQRVRQRVPDRARRNNPLHKANTRIYTYNTRIYTYILYMLMRQRVTCRSLVDTY